MKLTTKSRPAALALVLLAYSACESCYEIEPPCNPCTRGGREFWLVAQAKRDIAVKDYAAATAKCRTAEELNDTYDEAKYCVLAAQLGALVQSSGAVIGLVAAQARAPAYQPQVINVKSITASMLSDIESQMRYIDAYGYKLAAMENPHFEIDDFPLDFDPQDIIELSGTSVRASSGLSINLRGTWDQSEVMLLSAAVNAVQGVLDYAFAHKLVLATTDISFDTTSGVAEFLHDNPDLFAKDANDTVRLSGDGDKHKGLKNDVLAALSFLVGRGSDLELVAPTNDGLTAAIKQSAAESGTYSVQVVKWIDDDADGIPEAVGIPALNDVRDKLLDTDGKPIFDDDTLENPLSKPAWNAWLAFGQALRDNVESGGPPVGLAAPLQAVVDDLKTAADFAGLRLLGKPVPHALAIDPAAFLAATPYLAELTPYYYSYVTTGTWPMWELALEEERYDAASGTSVRHLAAYTGDTAAADWGHFDYDAGVAVNATAYLHDVTWHDFEAAPAPIAVDGVTATTRAPRLYYVALQDPSFGGLLAADLDFAGDYTAVDGIAVFNAGLNKLIKYYCLDFTLGEGLAGAGRLDAFDEAKYPATNKIAACE